MKRAENAPMRFPATLLAGTMGEAEQLANSLEKSGVWVKSAREKGLVEPLLIWEWSITKPTGEKKVYAKSVYEGREQIANFRRTATAIKQAGEGQEKSLKTP